MQIILPASFSKIISKLRSNKANTAALPTYQSHSQSTLFDDLPEGEKQAALTKLHDLAAAQPGQTKKRTSRRCFNWKTAAMVFAFLSLVVLATVALVKAVDKDVDQDLVAKLRMANTNLDRMALLPNDDDWVYDFTKSDKYTYAPGGVINANAATFPATVGQGMTMAMLNLGPCSMLPPHLHPRATNYVVAISGETQTYMINENGARTVQATLTPGKMTIFPTASVHTMMNVGCENAQLISALNSDDTGTMNLANAFFSLPANFTQTILGPDANLQALGGNVPAVGTGAAAGPEACIAACKAKGKLVRRSF
ncbi:Spherulin-1A [Cyphellophora attinorum]|uniref:Spherulin-1A n=1 Tax=Cyphellophora attinorum TaxID=1664694 RepID=A0A0N0NR86_9EURO|nr:Spherulin-1A [Phialophora attinorum]KPI44539.1 Spherulin-1A [Phialophora attinorum]